MSTSTLCWLRCRTVVEVRGSKSHRAPFERKPAFFKSIMVTFGIYLNKYQLPNVYFHVSRELYNIFNVLLNKRGQQTHRRKSHSPQALPPEGFQFHVSCDWLFRLRFQLPFSLPLPHCSCRKGLRRFLARFCSSSKNKASTGALVLRRTKSTSRVGR